MRLVSIPVPHIEEQNEIVKKLDYFFSVFQILDNTTDELVNKTEILRNSILKQAFEGKLVPQDPNDEPAEILLEKIKKQMPAKTRGKKNGT